MDDVASSCESPGGSPATAGEPFSIEVLLSLTPVTGGWIRRRHVFQYVSDPPASALAVALCSHTAPVGSLMVDDQKMPMCPSCLDIVVERYLDTVGLDHLVQVLAPRPAVGGATGNGPAENY